MSLLIPHIPHPIWVPWLLIFPTCPRLLQNNHTNCCASVQYKLFLMFDWLRMQHSYHIYRVPVNSTQWTPFTHFNKKKKNLLTFSPFCCFLPTFHPKQPGQVTCAEPRTISQPRALPDVFNEMPDQARMWIHFRYSGSFGLPTRIMASLKTHEQSMLKPFTLLTMFLLATYIKLPADQCLLFQPVV